MTVVTSMYYTVQPIGERNTLIGKSSDQTPKTIISSLCTREISVRFVVQSARRVYHSVSTLSNEHCMRLRDLCNSEKPARSN